MRLKLCVAIPLLAMLPACATRETLRIVDSSCTAFKAISFATPSKTKPETEANSYDTPDTVTEVIEHNARWDALCAKRVTP